MGLIVLVVDDDSDLRAAMSAVLEDAGHAVLQAENGVEALAVLAKERADVAVVDVMMPVMDGLALFDHIRAGKTCPSLPILLVTASRPPPSAIGRRDVPIVLKPVTPVVLLEAISRLLGSTPE
jgi:CheY-like chemotaxis protein